MRNNILIGSILAVAIIVLVSFSNVVGFQSYEYTNENISPLFHVRIGNAINDQDFILKNDYLGRDKNTIVFKKQSKTMDFIEELKHYIDNIDENKLQFILKHVKNRLPYNNFIDRYNKKSLFDLLNLIEKNTNDLEKIQYDFHRINNLKNPDDYTIGEPWYPGCFSEFISYIIGLFLLLIFGFFSIIYWMTHPTSAPTCNCPWS